MKTHLEGSPTSLQRGHALCGSAKLGDRVIWGGADSGDCFACQSIKLHENMFSMVVSHLHGAGYWDTDSGAELRKKVGEQRMRPGTPASNETAVSFEQARDRLGLKYTPGQPFNAGQMFEDYFNKFPNGYP